MRGERGATTFLDLLEDSGEDISRIGGDDVFVEALLRLDARPGVVDAELALELALGDGLQDACTVSQGGGASHIALPLDKVPSLLLATLKVALSNRDIGASLRVASALSERLPSSIKKQAPLRQSEDVTYLPTNESCRILQVHVDDDETFYTVRFGDGRERQTVASKLQRDSSEVDAPFKALGDQIAELRDASKGPQSAAWLATKVVRRLGASDGVFREVAVDALCAGDSSHLRALAATGTASERALAALTGDAGSCRFVAQTLEGYSLTDATSRRAADVMVRGLALPSDAERAAALICAAQVLRSTASSVVPSKSYPLHYKGLYRLSQGGGLPRLRLRLGLRRGLYCGAFEEKRGQENRSRRFGVDAAARCEPALGRVCRGCPWDLWGLWHANNGPR